MSAEPPQLVVEFKCERCGVFGPCTLQPAQHQNRWECRDGCPRPYELTLSPDECEKEAP